MNILASALTLVQNLIPNQIITIKNTTSQIVNGVARPLAPNILQTIAQIQPLTAEEIKMMDSNIASAEEYYRFWIMGNDIRLVKEALDSNAESFVLWRDKEYFCYSKTDWTLNGWIEGILALRGEIQND